MSPDLTLPAIAALLIPTILLLASFRSWAEEQSTFVQQNFYDPSAGLYRPSFPVNPDELPYDFMWGHGVQFTAVTAAARYQPDPYLAVLYDFANGLKRYWDPGADIPAFDAEISTVNRFEKYYDDNQWLILGFMEAYEVTGDDFFLNWARCVNRFSLSGWDEKLGGGIYWKVDHQSKNTCANAPAAAAAMRLFMAGHADDKAMRDWAMRIRGWVNATLRDPDDSLYWDNIRLDGEVNKIKYTYNTALMIRTDVLLYESTGEVFYLDAARRAADAAINHWVDPATGAIRDTPKFAHLLCEAFLRLHDTSNDGKYLAVARAYAEHAHRDARDPQGGYYDDWNKPDHTPGERKSLIENASAARLFWLLAAYDG